MFLVGVVRLSCLSPLLGFKFVFKGLVVQVYMIIFYS